MNQVEHDLKLRIRKSGLPLREVANRMSLSYVTLSGKLNGFRPFPTRERLNLEKILADEASAL